MRKNNKKGFTIVELVIVIAVIAILAAVLIPTFIVITKKANQSVDEQLVNNINKILTIEEQLEGKNQFMHDAIIDLKENGYDIDSLKLSDSENELVWEQRIDRFIIVHCTESGVEKVYNSKADDEFYANNFKRWKLCWKIYTNEDYVDGKLPRDRKQVFSIYWAGTGAPVFDDNGIIDVGLDLGTYEGIPTKAGTEDPIEFTFSIANSRVRGNFQKINIKAAGIYHIGNVDTLNFHMNGVDNDYINPVDYAHHEYGSVKNITLYGASLGTTNIYKLIAESGSSFKMTESEIKELVGESNFVNNGATFGTSGS